MTYYTAASPVFGTSISAAQFAAILRARQSPAAVEASAIHDVLVGSSIDPAVALGQFGAESTYGRAGYATTTRNWGNIAMATPGTPKLLRAAKIATHWSRKFGAKPYSPGNGYSYASFPTWRQGAQAYAALMTTYRQRGWATTITAMCRRWLGGIGTGYIATIVRIANQAAGSAATPASLPVVVRSPPPPVAAATITALRRLIGNLAAVLRPTGAQRTKLAAYRTRLTEYLRRGR